MQRIGVVLSGGKSRRMGEDKGLMQYRGKQMVQYSLDFLKSYCDKIVISSNQMEYQQFGLEVIKDLIPDSGPIGGVFSVMKQIIAEQYFVMPCDMPFPSELLAEKLLKYEDYEAVVPRHVDGKLEPLFAIYSRSILPFVERQIKENNFKFINIFDNVNIKYHDVTAEIMKESPEIFLNVNTKHDLK